MNFTMVETNLTFTATSIVSVSQFLIENCDMTDRITPIISSATSPLDISLERASSVVEESPNRA